MKKFHLSLLWDCNENCLFCAKGRPPAGVKPRLSLAKARALISEKRAEGCDTLALDGGEPTLLPYLPAVIAAALKAGYGEVQVLTNGVELADRGAVAAIEAAIPPRELKKVGFCFSLHSHRKAVSEKLTRSSNTYARTLAGIRNVTAAGFPFALYHVITEDNYRSLPAFSDFVIKKFPLTHHVTFSFIYPVFPSEEGMKVYPRLTLTQPYFSRAVTRLRKAGFTVAMSNCGIIPLCLMGGNETLFFKTFTENNIGSANYDTQKSELLPFFQEAFEEKNKTKAPQCGECALDEVCGGIWKLYARRYGTGELKPYRKAYFEKLPRSGARAELDLSEGLARPDPAAYARIRLLELRYRGFTRVALRGAGARLTAAAREFAGAIGCSALAPGQRAPGRTGKNAV